ncbi:hypothetical protein [Actinomadura flavalba]|uniref:hypothetical protein n=1 Tax=Actinomadura flavalba TaxID=1120938 RepID=UPI00036F6A9A|nr:hypothetical protein [Actinomadura flavalba]
MGGGVEQGVTGAAEGMMAAATPMAAAAALFLPPAFMISFQFRLATGKPADIMKAAYAWGAVADDLKRAAAELEGLVARLPAQSWTTDDRTAYEGHVREYIAQLDALEQYGRAVGVTLTVSAWALLSHATFALGMAVYLDALALASLTVAGAAPAQALAAAALTITTVVTAVLAATGQTCAVVLAGGAMAGASDLRRAGNRHADAALATAFGEGGRTAAVHLAQNGVNAGLAYVNRGDSGEVGGRYDRPLKEIDLDADRGPGDDWKLGAGARYKIGQVERDRRERHDGRRGRRERGCRAQVQGADHGFGLQRHRWRRRRMGSRGRARRFPRGRR